MPFHTDYRPRTLKEFFGNTQAKRILVSIFKNTPKGKYPHSYLLIGPRGCGKTTLARIIAKLLGCNLETDFKELNAASFRGIDTAREVTKTVNMKPLAGSVRVWFFDECHQLTKDAQEALLKVVEQPPAHAYFIFSTTDPQDLKPTLKDRCVTIPVVPLKKKEAVELIKYVCKKEGKNLPPKEVILKLLEVSECRPRALLMGLERVLGCSSLQEMLSVLDTVLPSTQVYAVKLCQLVLKSGTSWSEIGSLLQELKAEDPEGIRRMMLSYMTKVLQTPHTQADGIRAAVLLEQLLGVPVGSGFPGLTLACFKAWLELSQVMEGE